jgi:plasmid stability protein
MASLQIRDLPDPIYRLLVERAREERRTLAQEATVLLREALAVSEPPKNRRLKILTELSRERRRIDFGRIATPEQLIREDRDR